MDAGWAAVVGALVGSAVAGGLIVIRDVIEARRRRKAEGRAASEALLVHSMAVVQVANAFRLTMRIRSGLQEGIDVALGHREPVEPLDLADRLSAAFQPLFAAQAAAWAKGSRQVIPLVNELVNGCVELIAVATESGRAGSAATRYVFGERWTEEQEGDYESAAGKIGESRRKLATQLRAEIKSRPVPDLLG